MKRSDWILAGALVLVGMSCLIAAAVGYTNSSMMNMMGMMYWMPIRVFFGAFVCLVFIIVLVAFIYRVVSRTNPTCKVCHATVKKNWNVCPHCGSIVNDNTK